MGPEIFFLVLLQLKHFFFDFVNQTQVEIENKGRYGSWLGMTHSVKHGIGTFCCVWIVLGYPGILFALAMGALDLALHYHIDWAKMYWGTRDITDKSFWHQLGLDQLAHQLTYIIVLGLTFS
jgi:hypothetical protein